MIAAHPAPPPDTAADASAASNVAIDDRGYTPGTAVVAPGATVRWSNNGFNRHTVTADDGAFASDVLGSGARFTITAPQTPGVHTYHCEIHAFMRGTVTVSDLTLRTAEPVRAGHETHLEGVVPGAPAGTEVVVERRVAGAWVPLGSTPTDATGAYTLGIAAPAPGWALRARAGMRVSPGLRIAVAPTVVVQTRGSRFVARVRPARTGARARLERLDLETYRWHMVARVRLPAAGTITVRLRSAGVYRIVLPGGTGFAAVTSRAVVHLPYRVRR